MAYREVRIVKYYCVTKIEALFWEMRVMLKLSNTRPGEEYFLPNCFMKPELKHALGASPKKHGVFRSNQLLKTCKHVLKAVIMQEGDTTRCKEGRGFFIQIQTYIANSVTKQQRQVYTVKTPLSDEQKSAQA